MGVSIQTVWDHLTLAELDTAMSIYDEAVKLEKESFFILAVVYKVGVIQGKQMERVKRKGGIKEIV